MAGMFRLCGFGNNTFGYVIDYGEGVHMQHTYCSFLTWSESIPGDLVFYPGDSHVGIYVGADGNNPLIVHCAAARTISADWLAGSTPSICS